MSDRIETLEQLNLKIALDALDDAREELRKSQEALREALGKLPKPLEGGDEH